MHLLSGSLYYREDNANICSHWGHLATLGHPSLFKGISVSIASDAFETLMVENSVSQFTRDLPSSHFYQSHLNKIACEDLFHLVKDLTGWRSTAAKVKALPILLLYTEGCVIVEHIGGDPYWLGHLLIPSILTREGPKTTFLLPWHRMWGC